MDSFDLTYSQEFHSWCTFWHICENALASYLKYRLTQNLNSLAIELKFIRTQKRNYVQQILQMQHFILKKLYRFHNLEKYQLRLKILVNKPLLAKRCLCLQNALIIYLVALQKCNEIFKAITTNLMLTFHSQNSKSCRMSSSRMNRGAKQSSR